MTIRFSEIDQFLRCEYAWFLRYRRNLVPKKPMAAPLLGSAVHAGVAAALCSRIDHMEEPLYSGQKVAAMYVRSSLTRIGPDAEEATIEEHEKAEETAPLIVEKILNAFPAERYETILFQGTPAVELELVGHDPPAIAHLDWVCRDTVTNLIWCVDWKIRGVLKEETEDLDLQAMVYQYLLAKNGVAVAGTMNVQVSADLPAVPKLNKDGSMSRSAIRTDWETYRLALVKARLNPRNYEDMERKLEKVKFMEVTLAPRSMEFLENVWNIVVVPVWGKMQSQKTFQRHLAKFNCARCQYIPLCLGGLRGDDQEWIAKNQYDKEMVNV